MNSFQNEGYSDIMHVNSPFTSSRETYICRTEGAGIIKITLESMGIQ